MLTLLKTYFGYDEFRPLQKEIIDTILAGNDALVLMPTGGGKSLCYQLPALMFKGITIVISPLIALMKDQVDALSANGISAAFLNSSQSANEQTSVIERAQSGELKILYLAPERMNSFGFSEFFDSITVSLLAIDEAHCISEWGHDFRPEYRNLRSLRDKIASVPVIALTATATPRVQDDILNQLGIQKAYTFLSSFNRENLHYSVRPKYNAFSQLVELLQSHKNESTIVYCFSRKNTEEIAQNLSRAGFTALPYHAGLQKKERINTQEKFIRDEVLIIVATIAFGMGIDKPDVRLVVHMDLPKTIEGYYQETGRAGRDSLESKCVLFYSFADKRKQEYFINQINNPRERITAVRKLEEMIEYCQTYTCRRFYLLNYFGEQSKNTSCNACDNCVSNPTELIDATKISQMILSAVIKTGQRFGSAHVCDVLHGSRKKRIVELQHDKLSVHALAQNVSIDSLRESLQALKKLGYLEQNEGEYPTLRVTQKGIHAINNKESIELPVSKVIEMVTVSKNGTKSNLNYNVEVFEALRALRKQIADVQGVPPFVIFGDKSLHEMAYYLPSDIKAFSNLFGVGERKLSAFGEVFLARIREKVQELHLEQIAIPEKITRLQNRTLGQPSSTLEFTKQLLEKKYSIEQIAKERGLSPQTIVQHVEKLVYTNQVNDIEHLKTKIEKLQEIEQAFHKLGTTTLSPIYQYFEGKITYEELRLVRLLLTMRDS